MSASRCGLRAQVGHERKHHVAAFSSTIATIQDGYDRSFNPLARLCSLNPREAVLDVVAKFMIHRIPIKYFVSDDRYFSQNGDAVMPYIYARKPERTKYI